MFLELAPNTLYCISEKIKIQHKDVYVYGDFMPEEDFGAADG